MAQNVLPGTQTPSTKTVADVFTGVRSILNTTTTAMWTNADLLEWINDGITVISAHALCLGQTVDITIVADTLEYSIATLSPTLRYAAAVAAIYQPAAAATIKGLDYAGPDQIGKENAAGDVPNFFYLVDGRIGLWPIQAAGAAGVGKTVRVYLAELGAPVTATTDVIPLPAIFDTPLKHFVLAMAKYKDRKDSEGNLFMSLFDAVVQRYRIDFSEQQGAA